MKVRDLMRELVEFNPDANMNVVLENGKSTDFSLAWGSLDDAGMSKVKAKSVSIYVEGNEEIPNSQQTTKTN